MCTPQTFGRYLKKIFTIYMIFLCQLIESNRKSMERGWNRWIEGIQDRPKRVENSGYDEAGGRCSLGSLIFRRNHGVGMRRTGALQEEIKGSRAGASKYKPRIRWIRWARASSYSLGRRTVNRYERVSASQRISSLIPLFLFLLLIKNSEITKEGSVLLKLES